MRFLTLLLAAAALAFAGCGSDDDTIADAAPGGTGFPVTVKDKLGTAEIPASPKRVVALDFTSADAAIALGVVPVAMAKVDYAEGGVQPWTKDVLAGKAPELIPVTSGYPLEQIAAQRPDLILAANAYGVDKVYDKLSQLAPVVAYERGDGLDTWQQITLRIGRALGRDEQARELVDDVEGQVAAAREQHPAFAGSTVSFFNFFEGSPYVINSPEDFSIRFLSDLGFELPPTVAALKGVDNRAKVSSERLDVLDADVIMGTSPTPDELTAFARGRLFGRLEAVRRDAYVQLGLSSATSMAFPSPLSVPYGLREIVPQLADAVS